MNKMVILAAENVHKEYPTPEGSLQILRGVDFSLCQGEMAFIVGRSGSGKSTLLHLLGGLDRATEGRIDFKGNNLGTMSEKELALYRNLKIGFVFQFFHLLPELTLFENVLLPTLMARHAQPERARFLIDRVGLSGREDHFPGELSGGEQQRAAIARALVNEPDVVLCDEPTGNLDDETAGMVFQVLTELQNERNLSFVVVTHDESMARPQDAIYRLHEGILSKERIDGTPNLY